MELVKSLEHSIEGVHKGLPHLPAGFRNWLVENVWWLVAVSVALTVFSLISAFQALSYISQFTAAYAPLGAVYAQSSTWLWMTIAASVVQVVLLAMAISPLKSKQARGWHLLFIVSLVNVALSLLGIVFGGGVPSLLGALIGLAIGWYVLFEIRSGFVKA